MSVSTVTASPVQTPYAHQGHHAHGSKGSSSSDGATSTSQSNANETVQQRADQGDPTAIAEVQAERKAEGLTTSPSPESSAPHGPTEPGKGEQVDEYA